MIQTSFGKPTAALVLALLALVGCADTPADKAAQAREPKHVRGTATVLEINQRMGVGKFQTEDGPREFWWNSHLTLPGQDEVHFEAHEYDRHFPARVGDLIDYDGLETHGQIYVTHAQRKTPS